MDDYLSEKEQWEWLKTQIKESAPWVIAAVAAALLLLSGWRWWQGHADRLGIAASTQTSKLSMLSDAASARAPWRSSMHSVESSPNPLTRAGESRGRQGVCCCG